MAGRLRIERDAGELGSSEIVLKGGELKHRIQDQVARGPMTELLWKQAELYCTYGWPIGRDAGAAGPQAQKRSC